MATNFPTSLDNLDSTRGTSTQALNSPSHVTHHTNEDDALEAIETKIGVDSSSSTTSLDYILKNTTGGHDHDGTDSKKVVATNLDVAGLTVSELLRTNSGGTAVESSGKTVPTGTIVGTSDIQTLTNKTLTFADNTLTNVASLNTAQTISAVKTFSADPNLATGGNIQVNAADPKRAFYIPASAMTTATTNGAASGTYESATNKIIIPVFDFDTTTQEFVAIAIPSPHFWDASTITVQFIWTAASGSGGVTWAAQGIAFSDDDALDAAYGTEQIIVDTLITALDDHHTSFTPAITIAGTPVAGDLVCLRFKRVPADAGDTIANDVRLIGVKVRFTIGQYSDE